MDILHSGPVPVNFYCWKDAQGLIHLAQVGTAVTACRKSARRINPVASDDPAFPTCLQCALRS